MDCGQEQPPANEGMRVADQVSLARMVDLAAERLQLDVEYNPADLAGNVTAQRRRGE